MKNFIKDNWFKIIIAFLLICLVGPVINYINTETRYTVQKQNFYVWKWYAENMHIEEGNEKVIDLLLKRFGL